MAEVEVDNPFDQLDDVTGRFAALARSLRARDLHVEVNHGERTVGETVRHVCEQYRLTAGNSSTEHAASLEGTIAEIESLAPVIRETFAPLVVELGPGTYGAPVFVVTEATVHGHQIATEIEAASWDAQVGDVMLLWTFGIGLFQGLLRPEAATVSETWELRFPSTDPVMFTIDGGQVSGDASLQRGEHHVLEIDDPVDFTLGFPMCRHPVDDPEAALLASRFKPV